MEEKNCLINQKKSYFAANKDDVETNVVSLEDLSSGPDQTNKLLLACSSPPSCHQD